MPIYLFSNPKNEDEVIEIIMSVHEKHEYSKDGVKWNRVFTKPNAAIDTKWDANSPQDFVEKSAKYKGGTVKDLWDKSAELSAKREKEKGKDPVKEQYYKEYSKKHMGKDHPEVKKKKLKDRLAKSKSMFEWSD